MTSIERRYTMTALTQRMQQIMDSLMHDIELYLAFSDIARS